MRALHTERVYEDEFVGHLIASGGWLAGDPQKYDRESGLYVEDVIGWIQDSQPIEYAKVKIAQNGATDKAIIQRLKTVIEDEGPLAIMRSGFKRVNARFDMCAFKPGHGLNPETLEKYGKVRCRVVRQVHYSLHNQKSIDVVLFVNGIPVATIELKTDNTQSIEDAVKQYKTDRLPKDPVTGKIERLLTYKQGALVHFAVSTDEVQMTTRLDGPKTSFLPFNLGNDEGKGNPPNPNGFRTSYLYMRVLQRDAWLEIIEKYLTVEIKTTTENGKKKESERLIFPRYHQWDAVKNLTQTASVEGPGRKYLIQHSAGSGKSNTIMWLAHQLTSLHDASDKKVFNSVIVVTDRQVLDEQLQENIAQFKHENGLIKKIEKGSAKSTQLVEALKKKTDIIILTIQTFPFALDAIAELDMQGRNFAVIADEAHSSQTGDAAKKLREALGIVDGDDPDDDEISAEDALLIETAKRANAKNISFFAFTATPKAKTIELFGRPDADGKKRPFHLYSMQQAIEEGFILDVLQNYTTYDVAYKIATKDDKTGEKIVPQSEAARLIKQAQKLHTYAIDQKVQIIVEHFRETVQPLLDGRAKAMVVCDSRVAAVRYKLAIEKYILAKKYKLAALVAFSGEVTDNTSGIDVTYTEPGMNGLKGESIPEAFASDTYHVLIVAEKFQTGFDQPLLVAMYVDKKLANIAAVQTLSRLNRTYERDGIKKENTFVLDFVNKGDDILSAFLPYYKVAELSEATDPDLIHGLQKKLDGAGVYTSADVEAYFQANIKAHAAKNGDRQPSLLKAVLDPVIERFNKWLAKAKAGDDSMEIERAEIFKRNVSSFVRAYAFLSQIFDYGDTDLEKRSIFLTGLARLLKDNDDQVTLDLSGVTMTHFNAKVSRTGALDLKSRDGKPLKPLTDLGTGKARDERYEKLADIIKALNDVFGSGIEDEHQFLDMLEIAIAKVSEVPSISDQAVNNSLEQFKNVGDISSVIQEKLVETKDEITRENNRKSVMLDENFSRLFGDKSGLAKVIDVMADHIYRNFNATP